MHRTPEVFLANKLPFCNHTNDILNLYEIMISSCKKKVLFSLLKTQENYMPAIVRRTAKLLLLEFKNTTPLPVIYIKKYAFACMADARLVRWRLTLHDNFAFSKYKHAHNNL